MNLVWSSRGCRGYLSLVLLLEFEATLDAAPRLQENLPLRVVGQVVDEQACCVHAQVQQAFGKNLHPRESQACCSLVLVSTNDDIIICLAVLSPFSKALHHHSCG